MHHIASRSLPWKICELRASCISPTSPKKKRSVRNIFVQVLGGACVPACEVCNLGGSTLPVSLEKLSRLQNGRGASFICKWAITGGFSYFLLLDCFNLWGGGLVVPPLLLQCLYTWSYCTLFHCISMCCTVSKLIALCQNAVHCMY